MYRYGIAPCLLGLVGVAWSEDSVYAIELGDSHDAVLNALMGRFPGNLLKPAPCDALATLDTVRTFIDAPIGPLELPLAMQGTAFQLEVWRALRQIPVGTTLTYRELAQKLGKADAVRAVANACGANHLAVAVPCHRIVRSDGGLGGYRWGLERKKALLNLEATLAASAS
ncbi:MAG TPA: methylated-DNA--[protein]-cysteine S-methyltransferase [Marinobacter sp.]|nr:methylated-DNA--[protein]-cysteine S-methyltransferase [Marinobacter sp.]